MEPMVDNSSNLLNCPQRTHWVSFRLLDESGNGASFAGLPFRLYDSQGQKYEGQLDEEGFARLENLYCGVAIVGFPARYAGGENWYEDLLDRKAYPLPLTAVQIAAEQTPIGPRQADGKTYLAEQRAQVENAAFYRVEVSDLVEVNKHLPDPDRTWEPRPSDFLKLAAGKAADQTGIALAPNQHHVLEVKALRAYNPLFSLAPEFCALNAYHLAVMSTFAYASFHHEPGLGGEYRPSPPPYDIEGTIGHVFREQLARQVKPTLFNTARYHLLCEEVPYSKRLEIVPYDPDRYPQQQEGATPESQHFLYDCDTGTQAFVVHNDKMILISIRGTTPWKDIAVDLDARQVPIEGGVGQAHRGFHHSFQAIKQFVGDYLVDFYTGEQTLLVCGHSLGGAVALLLAEWLRNTPAKPKVMLYTFGAPRAGDSAFVASAGDLVHHRLVNHNDMVPGVPYRWMDAEWKMVVPATAMLLGSLAQPIQAISLFLAGLINLRGDPYEHHGNQYHFIPRQPGSGSATALLWQPQSSAIADEACARCASVLALEKDMPKRANTIRQIFSLDQHSSDGGYCRAALTTLLRWNASLSRNGELFTQEEKNALRPRLDTFIHELAKWEPGTLPDTKREVQVRFDSRFYRMPDTELRALYHDGVLKGREEQRMQLADLSRARQRLLAQSEQPVTAEAVFGDLVGREDVLALFAEWRQIQQNREAELLAMPLVRTGVSYA